jgi:hypothetical protein
VSIRELTKFIWGQDDRISALLEQELQGFAKALDTSSDGVDDDDDHNEFDGGMEREARKECGSSSQPLRTPRHSPTTQQLLTLDEATISPMLDELTQLNWGTSTLVDGQRYWFDIRKPAELHWTVPLELAGALRRLRAELHAKASVADRDRETERQTDTETETETERQR